MTQAIGFIVVFAVLIILMGLGITKGLRKKEKETIPQARVGIWVGDALLWSPFAAFGNPKYDNRVTGEVTELHANGTMTVRDWESGDELKCLATGFLTVPSHEEAIMRRLRTDQDSHDMGESPSRTVH